jgi:CHAT domain
MTNPIDIEVGLQWRRNIDSFDVSLQYSNPINDSDTRVLTGPLQFDYEHFAGLADDNDAYGRLLGEILFGLPDVTSLFETAKAAAKSASLPLRLRLLIDPSAPAVVHALRWETLRNPRDRSRLAIAESILFSRYLSSSDWRPILVRPKRELSALVAVADLIGVDQPVPGGQPFVPVDFQGELAAAQAAHGVHRVSLLTYGRATLDNIIAELERDGAYDALHLVCHSALRGSETLLVLAGPDGGAVATRGTDLVQRLRQLNHQQLPSLVILSGCQSAGREGASSLDRGALAALGPLLGEVGVAAVVAMQSNINVSTVAAFMTPFFHGLREHGIVDLAMAKARSSISNRPDWWAPVLFMRVRSGRIWYPPGLQPTRQLRAFLCHSSSDKPAVRLLYRSLRNDDITRRGSMRKTFLLAKIGI